MCLKSFFHFQMYSPTELNYLHLITPCRKNELHQVAQQASNIDDLREVVRASLSVMHKQWSDAMSTFHEKFDSLSNLISDHGKCQCNYSEANMIIPSFKFFFFPNYFIDHFFFNYRTGFISSGRISQPSIRCQDQSTNSSVPC